MPVSEDPINTSAVLARPNGSLASSRPDINQVITNQPDLNLSVLSAQERARKNSERIAAKKAQIEARRAFELSMLRRPIMPMAISKKLADLASSDSLKKFFATGEVDPTLKDGFEEMGRNYNDWASVKNRFGLTDAQINLLRNAHHIYFGIPVDNVISSPSKKPNVLLLVGVAVVGLLVIRKVLN
jgi:hypothetical protein